MRSNNSVNPLAMGTFHGEAIYAAGERWQILLSVINQLEPRDKAIVLLRAQSYPLEHIAEAFDLSRESVRQIEIRAYALLREYLCHMGVDSLSDLV
ncbi:MAG: hypothetical protein IT168_33195 [Bryobacterales bacterium]|nr:hypothetical protein [Bryobacterales bacterium]